MLELDFAHRAGSSLNPKLRGQIRCAAARAIHSDYGIAYALADLRAAHVGEDEIRVLTGDPDSLPDTTRVTHLNLYDGTIEGLRHINKPIFSVQYHPEASPGPHDADYLFQEFLDEMEKS